MPHANNKGTDQSAYPCSLISTFFVRCCDSIIPTKFQDPSKSLKLTRPISVLPGHKLPKTGFLAATCIWLSWKQTLTWSFALITEGEFFVFPFIGSKNILPDNIIRVVFKAGGHLHVAICGIIKGPFRTEAAVKK